MPIPVLLMRCESFAARMAENKTWWSAPKTEYIPRDSTRQCAGSCALLLEATAAALLEQQIPPFVRCRPVPRLREGTAKARGSALYDTRLNRFEGREIGSGPATRRETSVRWNGSVRARAGSGSWAGSSVEFRARSRLLGCPEIPGRAGRRGCRRPRPRQCRRRRRRRELHLPSFRGDVPPWRAPYPGASFPFAVS